MIYQSGVDIIYVVHQFVCSNVDICTHLYMWTCLCIYIYIYLYSTHQGNLRVPLPRRPPFERLSPILMVNSQFWWSISHLSWDPFAQKMLKWPGHNMPLPAGQSRALVRVRVLLTADPVRQSRFICDWGCVQNWGMSHNYKFGGWQLLWVGQRNPNHQLIGG